MTCNKYTDSKFGRRESFMHIKDETGQKQIIQR